MCACKKMKNISYAEDSNCSSGLENMQNICSSKLQNMCPTQNFHQLQHINTSEYLGHADIHRTAPQPQLQLQGWTNFNGCQKFGL